MKSIKTALFGVFAAFILSACGGGGGGGSATPSVQIPSRPLEPVVLNPSDGRNYRTSEFNNNYGLGRINADSAYQRKYFGQGATVAVVDSGVRLSHRELADATVPGRDFVFPGTPVTDPHGHGTAVASIIGGERDGAGMHGVAPRAWIMPLKIGDSAGNLVGNHRDAFRHAINSGVPIINASFGTGSEIVGDYRGIQTYRTSVPFLRGFSTSNDLALARDYANIVRNRDVVIVWGAGNAGWNGENGRIQMYRCTSRRPQDCPTTNSPTIVTRNQFVNGFVHENHNDRAGNFVRGHGAISAVAGSDVSDVPSFDSLAPLYAVNGIDQLLEDFYSGAISSRTFSERVLADSNFRAMRGKWLVVVATDSSNRIASYSNGCGLAQSWCLAAPGSGIFAADSDNNVDYEHVQGTSFAAPHVSGALALLKSVAPEFPMTVLTRILLTTATDLGDDGVDPVYGWGLVNVDAGIEHIANLETANGLAYSDLRESLPSEFSHLRGRLSDVSVALKITDDSYYNIPLSDIVGGDSQKTKLGNAAKEMQADDFTAGESFRFWGGLEYDGSRSSYIGEGGGIFSAENASDTGGYVKWTTKNYGGISAFGEYGRTQIKADYDSASFISQIQNARAEEWTAGFQYRDLFLHNDSLQFSARQESRISGGEMVLHYPIADGDSHKAFIGESVQTIRTETAKIPIKQKPQTIYTAGYSQKTENGKWTTAAEWNAGTNAKGVSFAVELQIR